MPTGHQHGATGHTNRPTEGTGAIISQKAEDILGQGIQMGRFNMPVAMGADRIGSLVIRKKENDIGATGVR